MLDRNLNIFDIPGNDRMISPRIPFFSDIGVSDYTRDILENGGKQVGNKPKNAATELDIFSLLGFNNQDLHTLILRKIKVDISTKEGRKRIYELYSQALGFYSQDLFRSVSKEVSAYTFSTEESIYDFLNQTHSGGTRRQSYCNLVKIIFLLAEQQNAQSLKDLDLKACYAIQEYFIPIIQIIDLDFPMKTKNTIATITENIDGIEKVVRFKLRFRAKSDRSNVIKMGYNPEYYSTDLIGDSIGIEYEIDNPSDLLFIQEYFYRKIFKQNGENITVSDKNILELVKDNARDFPLDRDFSVLLGNIDTGKKPQTGVTYRDLKTSVKLPILKNLHLRDSQKIFTGFEVRGVLSGNKNNSGLADHRIYDFFKKISFMIRVQGYVTEAYVKLVINKFYETYPEASFSKDSILEHYLGSLMKVYFGDRKTIYYTTEERYNTLSQRKDLYPEGIQPGRNNL